MKSKSINVLALAFLTTTLSVVGCADSSTDKGKTESKAKSDTHDHSKGDHDHAKGETHDHGKADVHDHTPKHGGVMTEAAHTDFELVAKADLLQLYVADHGKKLDIDGATAKLTLLSGAEKQDVEMKVAGDKFEATGTFKVAPGTKAVAVVTLKGKAAISARFTLK